jgi:hypothetical protein
MVLSLFPRASLSGAWCERERDVACSPIW